VAEVDELIDRVRQQRAEDYARDIQDAIEAAITVRNIIKTRTRLGDSRGRDMAIFARLAIDDLLEHLEARR
jgi:hypothetical protein